MDDIFKTEVTLSKSGFLFDHTTGLTYTLNDTGRFIFQALKEGSNPEEILAGLTEEFAVDEGTARRDLDDFLRQLKELGITD